MIILMHRYTLIIGKLNSPLSWVGKACVEYVLVTSLILLLGLRGKVLKLCFSSSSVLVKFSNSEDDFSLSVDLNEEPNLFATPSSPLELCDNDYIIKIGKNEIY
jgi:hypothetical protein